MSARTMLFVWSATIALMVSYLTVNLSIVSNIGQFMPTTHQDSQLQALMSEIQNGPAATTLMIRLSGTDSAKLADLSNRLSSELNTQANVFNNVRNNNASIDHNSVNSLFPYRYLLSNEQDWGSLALKKNFEQRIIELRTGAGTMFGNFLTTDPQMVFLKYLHGLFDVTGPTLHHEVWFDKNLESALLLVSVRSNSLDLDIMQHAVQVIGHSFSTLTSEADIEIAGPGIMAVDTRTTIENVVTNLSVFMTILLIIVFTFAYRNLFLLLLAGIPLLSAIVVALSVTQAIFHEVHGIVLAFGITLLGVCLDYPLHLFSRLRIGDEPLFSLNKIWPTLLLSAISSVLAYLALLGSGFDGLNQLAIFAASGLITALVVTRFLLPFWVSPDQVRIKFLINTPALSLNQKKGLAILLLCLPLILIIQVDDFWETSVDAISPVPLSARESDRKLRHDLNAPEVSHVFLQSGDSVEMVLQASEHINNKLLELQTLGIISAIWSPSQILPSIQSQRRRQQSLPTKQQLTSDLDEALADLPFRPASFNSWIESVTTSHELSPLDYATITSTPLAPILRQGLFKHGDLWVSTIRVSGVLSNEKLYKWLDQHPEVKESHVEIKRATEHLLTEYRKSIFERFVGVILLLSFIILLWSRNLVKTIWILLPVSIGIVSGLAMPLLMGSAINIFHLLALLLVLGMGIDYSLFFNRSVMDSLEKQQTVHAISISAVTTSAAFSVLAFSSVPVMAAMGQTVAAGIIMCFASAWLLSSSSAKHS